MRTRIRRTAAASAALSILVGGGAFAATGDILRVAGEVVNLRAGPSDDTNVRGRVENGEQLLEITRDGDWRGVRVLRTGEEGWVYGGLLEPVATSSFGAGGASVGRSLADEDAGFRTLSESFNRLMANINAAAGYPAVRDVRQDDDTLLVTPTEEWLISGSRDAHLMTAAAIYEMWKNHQNSAPVRVVMTDAAGQPYVTVDDSADQLVTVAGPSQG